MGRKQEKRLLEGSILKLFGLGDPITPSKSTENPKELLFTWSISIFIVLKIKTEIYLNFIYFLKSKSINMNRVKHIV